MTVALVLFNRDLRVHDNPALVAASTADTVVPLFVLDPAILATTARSPNRLRFLRECLDDLDASLRRRGVVLVVRSGDPVEETLRLAVETGATCIHTSRDVSATAQRREWALAGACARARVELAVHDGVTVVPPDALSTTSGGHYRVFTPYLRVWESSPRRAVLDPPAKLAAIPGVSAHRLADLDELATGMLSPAPLRGGESVARAQLATVAQDVFPRYADARDMLAADATSKLSGALHFGCLSPLELEQAARSAGCEELVRQLAWRDFHHQLTFAVPTVSTADLRPAPAPEWRTDAAELDAWTAGATGYPIVDAGMRQLLEEGWMHGRARMVVATFLTKHLGHDWREGAQHFARLLVDADVANNAANWQWVAGTGCDTRPGRILNPLRQAERFDRDGDYVRRYVPELAGLDRRVIQTPWLLPAEERRLLEYPERIVDHEAAAEAFRLRYAHARQQGQSTRRGA